MEFPRLVYKSASEHELAEDQDQYDGLIKDGWFGSVPEAKDKKHAAKPVVEAPPTRAELEAKAKELGIGFNKNTDDADLLKRITDKLAA